MGWGMDCAPSGVGGGGDRAVDVGWIASVFRHKGGGN